MKTKERVLEEKEIDWSKDKDYIRAKTMVNINSPSVDEKGRLICKCGRVMRKNKYQCHICQRIR